MSLASALESGSDQESAAPGPNVTWAETLVAKAGPVPLDALTKGFGRFTGAQAQAAYATSALAVGRLLTEAGGPAIVNLLRDLGEGQDFDAAFLHRIQRSFADFQRSAGR